MIVRSTTIGELYEVFQEIALKEAVLLSLNQRLYREQRESDFTYHTEKEIGEIETHISLLKAKEI
jgi:hypothetical protein